MKNICIGIHVHAEPEKLLATLSSLRINTSHPFELLLLPDGPDEETCRVLESLQHLPQLGTKEPLGQPACFNRFAAATDAGILILLESGALMGQRWLDHILAALKADRRNGIAGPSTNRSWNEQGVYLHSGGTADDVFRTAQDVQKRFGSKIRTLGPLYSLADFCYALKREVVDTIGAADEGYGSGPCWEMDYNIRAARAGFQGVWACAAYVHRSPFTSRRQRNEIQLFSASKHRYQDKFCKLKLESKKQEYCRHCEGDACQYFAPEDLIQIKLNLNGDKRLVKSLTTITPPGNLENDMKSLSITTSLPTGEPLVSCIMPTHNRRPFVSKAIDYFLRQDYKNRELIIVDDGTDPIKDILPDDTQIRYIQLNQRITIGAARNIACKEAKGKIIVHWDDDDWMASWRLSYQVGSLLEKKADICGLNRILYYEPASGKSWQFVYPENSKTWVGGNTLCYTRSFWETNPFPDINVGEDTRFLWSNRSKNIFILPDFTFFVAMIHSQNSCKKRTKDNRWHNFPYEKMADIMGKDWILHANPLQEKKKNEQHVAPGNGAKPYSNLPLVSCIMPTYNRRLFVPQALKYFLRQDYPNKELVVVDDGTDKIVDLIPRDDRIKYISLEQRVTIGHMRNLAVEHSKGEIIVHWDDDDWYANNRITYQVRPLLEGKAEISGLDTGYIFNLQENNFWTCNPDLHARMFYADIHGGSIVYKRDIWEKYGKYPDISLAEDAVFIKAILKKSKIIKLPNNDIFVYIRHGANAWKFNCGRFLNPGGWNLLPTPTFLPPEDIRFYQDIISAFRVC